MANFSVDDIDISPDEFLEKCSEREIIEVVLWLIENKYIKQSKIDYVMCDMGYMSIQQTIFNEHLDALENAYYSLSKEEEEEILKISKKFK